MTSPRIWPLFLTLCLVVCESTSADGRGTGTGTGGGDDLLHSLTNDHLGGTQDISSQSVQPLSQTERHVPGSALIRRYDGSNLYYSLNTDAGANRRICGGMTITGKDFQICLTQPGVSSPPSSDSWVPTTTIGAPSPRANHAAVWTGSKMLIWGGYPMTKVGGLYDPVTNSWSPTTSTNAPAERSRPTAIWTGTKAIFWGGVGQTVTHRARRTITDFNPLKTGGLYDPAANTWTAMTTSNAPAARARHTAVWTGSKMIVWSGYFDDGIRNGGIYDPATDVWSNMSSAGAPSWSWNHTAVWTGTEMLIWGGRGDSAIDSNAGYRYNLAANSWSNMSTTGAPSPRSRHVAVWTGTKMLVWGGAHFNGLLSPTTLLNNGGIYDPATDSWGAIASAGAPDARSYATAVWTGSQMIVWGGGESPIGADINPVTMCPDLGKNTGGRYNVATNSWLPTSMVNVPSARCSHTAVWSGTEMIVWGGGGGGYLATGGRYSP